MPGFTIRDGGSGKGPPNNLELAHEHRWVISQLGNIIERNELLIAKEVSLPEYDIDLQEILGGLIYYKYAKSVRWKDIHVVFYDNGKIIPKLEGWRGLVYTNNNGIGKHDGNSSYKKDSTFDLLDGAGNVLYSITLKQSWPKQILYGKLSYTSSEIKVVDLVLSYDYAILDESPGSSQTPVPAFSTTPTPNANYARWSPAQAEEDED